MNTWENLIGTLCFNIWHSTNEEFENSGELVDMEWPFLCTFHILHNWDHSELSKRYSVPALIPQADPSLIKFRDAFIELLPGMKEKISQILLSRKMNARMAIEPSKIFITLFTENLINALENSMDQIPPMDFFQAGVELLLLITLELKEKDREFYDQTYDIGRLEKEEADAILVRINRALVN